MIDKIIDTELFQKFLVDLEKKMLAGITEHGETRHETRELVDELQAEALDFAGWGFLFYRKLEKMKKKVLKFETETQNLTIKK